MSTTPAEQLSRGVVDLTPCLRVPLIAHTLRRQLSGTRAAPPASPGPVRARPRRTSADESKSVAPAASALSTTACALRSAYRLPRTSKVAPGPQSDNAGQSGRCRNRRPCFHKKRPPGLLQAAYFTSMPLAVTLVSSVTAPAACFFFSATAFSCSCDASVSSAF